MIWQVGDLPHGLRKANRWGQTALSTACSLNNCQLVRFLTVAVRN